MASNIIETTDEGIVLTERPFHLSDAKLQLILIATYEKAIDDVTGFKFLEFYDICFSIATTLLIALFTTDFHGIGDFDAELVKGFMIAITIILYFWGIVSFAITLILKAISPTKIRDKSINDIITKSKQQS